MAVSRLQQPLPMAKKWRKEKPSVGRKLRKQVRRVVRKHGPTIAIGLITGLVLDFAEGRDR